MSLTMKEKREIAEMVAQRVHELGDEMLSLKRASDVFDISKSWLYRHAEVVGVTRVGKKLFFSRNNLNALIASGALDNRCD